MCIFCKIANHEIPTNFLYEDDEVIAFLDISQVTKGHTLIVCKRHYATFLDAPSDLIMKMMKVAKVIAPALMKSFHASGLNILNNNYAIAGQSVDHLHFHLIPRYDETDAITLQFNESAPQDLQQLYCMIKEQL